MSKLIVKNGIVIDEVENVLTAIRNLTGKGLKTPEVIKKFIISEKSTMFYVDKKMNTKMEDDGNCTYLWLDTGCLDSNNKHLFVSLLKTYDGYQGHITGTIRFLMENMLNWYPKNKSYIKQNYSKFIEKYSKKCEERTHHFIADEDKYMLDLLNGEVSDTEIGNEIKNLKIVFEEPVIEEVERKTEKKTEEITESMSREEEEITISMLWELVEQREAYVQELLAIIEKSELENTKEMEFLRDKNKELSEAIQRIQDFMVEEEKHQKPKEEILNPFGKEGHKLLGRNRHILIIGATEIKKNVMCAIAENEFGFEKKDLVFEIDYTKLNNAGKRVVTSGRYRGVIFGPCPHKVSGMGAGANFLDNYRSMFVDIAIADARLDSGELKITKKTYRDALQNIYQALSQQPAYCS